MSAGTPSQDYLAFEAAMEAKDPKWFQASPAAIGYMAWCVSREQPAPSQAGSCQAREPVTCSSYECRAGQVDGVLCANEECDIAAGHRAPPAGRTLTDDEISEIAERVGAIEPTDSFWQEFARAILAASSTTAGERDHG